MSDLHTPALSLCNTRRCFRPNRVFFISLLSALALLLVTCKGTQAATKKYDLRRMQLVYAVLGKVRTRYVNPSRVHPRDMLLKALNNIQRKIPEVIVWHRQDDNIEIQVDAARRKFNLGSVNAPWKLTAKLQKVFAFVQKNLRPDTDRKEVEYAAVDGILSTLDPHSVLMRPDFFRQMEVDTSGSFGGLGIEISICEGVLTIRRPLKHTPAWKTKVRYGRKIVRIAPKGEQGVITRTQTGYTLKRLDTGHRLLRKKEDAKVVRLKGGDKIVRIENESTINMTLTQAVKRLRGRPNTDVIIWIKRKGWKRARPFPIRRAKINIPSVSWRILSSTIGYLKLKKFQATTTAEVKQALRRMFARSKGQSPPKGLILDLRNNHGGLLDQAVRVVDAFSKGGTIVSTMGFAGRRRRELRATRKTTVAAKLPIVVLVNGESASAAEIVASALKQLNRAVIIGENTFGKGSVQVIFKTPHNTGLKLTVSQWFAPGNFSVQRVGLTPDIETVPVEMEDDEPIVYFTAQRQRRRERDLKQALKQGRGSTSLKSKAFVTLHYLKQPIPDYARGFHCRFCGQSPDYSPPRNPDVFLEDFQIKLARGILRKIQKHRRLAMLAKAKSYFRQVRKREQKKITAKFKGFGVDWSTPPAKSKGPVTLKASVTAGTAGHIKAGNKLKIDIKVKNTSNQPAWRVRAETRSTNPRLENLEFFFGRIPPGQTRTASVKVRIPKGYPAQRDEMVVQFFEAFGHTPKPITQMIHFDDLAKPQFAYAYELSEAARSNHNGLFEVGEDVRLKLVVRNTGKGAAQQGYASLANLSGPALFVKKGRFDVSGLRPGRKKTFSFDFNIKREPKKGLVRLKVTVRDCLMGRSVGEKLTLKVWPAGTQTTALRGVAKVVRASPQEPGGLVMRQCPDADCSIVAICRTGSTVPVFATIHGWLMGKLKGRKIFFKSSHVKVSKKRRRARPRFRALWNVVQPQIQFSGVKPVVTGDSIELRGTASHAIGVADLFIRVSNKEADIFSRKVFYKSCGRKRGQATLAFKADVQLWPGKNVVQVVARANERVTASRILVILRKPTGLLKEVKQQIAKRDASNPPPQEKK